jgi:hypothetical protein
MEPNRWTIDDDGDLRRGERLPLRSDGTTVRTVFGLLCTDELRERRHRPVRPVPRSLPSQRSTHG